MIDPHHSRGSRVRGNPGSGTGDLCFDFFYRSSRCQTQNYIPDVAMSSKWNLLGHCVSNRVCAKGCPEMRR